MEMTTTDPNLREEVQNSRTPTIDDSDEGNDDSGGFDLGISRKTLAILGIVALVVVIVWLTRQSAESGGSADPPVADDGDDGDDDSGQANIGGEITIPNNPSEELDKDAAVLDGLREAGVMGVDG